MKKLLLMLCMVLTASAIRAGKADTRPVIVTQTDGSKLTVLGFGDEHHSWYTTTDGVILAHVGYSYYVANIDNAGNITPSSQLAHEAAERSAAEQALVKAQNREAFFSPVATRAHNSRMRRINIDNNSIPYFPHTGSPKAPVLLVQFADVKFSSADPKRSFHDYMNAEGPLTDYDMAESRNYGSVRQYFNDMSKGAFTPQFDVIGPITVSKKSAYYGAGEKEGGTRIHEMINEACTQAQALTDLSQYDANHDGLIDAVYIIYAGYSESMGGNSADDIWPKAGYIPSNVQKTFGTVKAVRYAISSELNYNPSYTFKEAPYKRICGVGLFCHEFSHTLGLPDTYSGLYEDNQEMEYWDLMDNGEYTDIGYTPTPYTPWEKETMGWTKIDTLTEAAKVTLNEGDYRKIVSDVSKEYLIVENFQKTGWAKKMRGHGMLVYRIDYPYDKVNMSDFPNSKKGKPAITVVPADGLLMSSYKVHGNNAPPTTLQPYSREEYLKSLEGDPYPGTSNVTEILSVQLNGSKLEKPMYYINETTNGVITFNFLKKDIPAGIAPIVKENGDTTDNRVFTIDGRFVGTTTNGLPKGIYIINKKKVVIR